MPVIVQPDPEERKKALLEKQRRQRRRKEKIENDRQKSMGLRRGLLGRKGEKQVVPKAAVDVLIAKSMAVPSRARYTFSITDIRKYYLHNKSFQEIINTGKYFYFENHLVLMTKEAFIVKNGKLSLNCELTDFEKKYCVQCLEEKISHVVKTPLHS